MRTNRLVLLFLSLVALIAFILWRNVDGFVDAGRCGVGLPSCPETLRCINGYCKSDHPPAFPGLSDLPLAN
jgi:hypothetical protein